MGEPDIIFVPAISLWEPWAILWLIVTAKVNETRHWAIPRHYIGKRTLVHAAKKRVPLYDLDEELIEVCRFEIGSEWQTSIPYGEFAGSTTLAACQPMGGLMPALPAHANDAICGNWSPERYAWRSENPRIFTSPIPAKGQQGFWTAGLPRALLTGAAAMNKEQQ